MYGLQDGEQALHQKAAPRRVERDEETSRRWSVAGLMIDTFIHDSDALIIITTGVVLPHLIWSQRPTLLPTYRLTKLYLASRGNVRGPTPEIVDPTESRPRSRNRAQDRGISVVISAVAWHFFPRGARSAEAIQNCWKEKKHDGGRW